MPCWRPRPLREESYMRHPSFLRGVALTVPVLLVGLATTAATTAQAAQSRPSGQAALTSAQARSLSANVTDKVIVLLKNQLAALPDSARNSAARSASVRSLQGNV